MEKSGESRTKSSQGHTTLQLTWWNFDLRVSASSAWVATTIFGLAAIMIALVMINPLATAPSNAQPKHASPAAAAAAGVQAPHTAVSIATSIPSPPIDIEQVSNRSHSPNTFTRSSKSKIGDPVRKIRQESTGDYSGNSVEL